MLRPRVIPCLLVHEGGLVKTFSFKSPKYVGDPMNAVKIFNEKEADEIIVLDIDATARGVEPDYGMISDIAMECQMPLCYGGGITSPAQAKKIIRLGVEKVAISAAAINNPNLISQVANEIGRQSVVVALDVRKRLFNKDYEVLTHNGTRRTGKSVYEMVEKIEELGVGEIVINSIDNDGKMKGYDLMLAKNIRDKVNMPTTFLGGAGSLDDVGKLIEMCGTVGAAAGSLFVFKGVYKAVLINYPNMQIRDNLIKFNM